MKRPFSLLEICIGLALTTILLTALFNGFRQLMVSGAEIERTRSELHPYLLFPLRMQQIFDAMPSNALCYTDPHEEAKGSALYLTFLNGVDPEPEFCGEVEGVLFQNKENEIVLKLNNERTETLFTPRKSFSIEFFDPKEKTRISEWKKEVLPPFIYIQVQDKEYAFLLPKAHHEAEYP